MIASPWFYLFVVGVLGSGFWFAEVHSRHKLFTWLPAIVLVYLLAIALSQGGLFARTPLQETAYADAKRWLLPMMLFLMMLRLDLKGFAALGPKLMIAYGAAVISLAFSFIAVFVLFGFGPEAAGVFGALSGSWTGGTANMLAVAGALEISDAQLGPALIVDSVLYTVWIVLLLLLVPFAGRFDRRIGAVPILQQGTAADTHPLRMPLQLPTLLLLAAAAAAVSLFTAERLPLLPSATWLVLGATLLGVAGSLTPLRRLGGSAPLASFLLYNLIALVGSHASLQGFDAVPRYLAAAALILVLHATLMLLVAGRFRLNLFSIAVASLANIGGVASAPILAAAYHRSLVGVAVLMAIMGYLIGTVAGLAVASALKALAA